MVYYLSVVELKKQIIKQNMLAYKFRLLHEDQDDFLRDIEIKPSQTYKDLHDCLVKTIGLSGKELASFFVCNHHWRKQREITLINMMDREERPAEIDIIEEGEEDQKILPTLVMEDVKIKDLIEDPHQRFLYEYDFLNPKTFFLELIKISDIDEKKIYPVVVKEQGLFVTNTIPQIQSILDEPDEETMLKEFDEMLDNEDGFGEEVDENFTTEPEW
jgi:hypothetical protein